MRWECLPEVEALAGQAYVVVGSRIRSFSEEPGTGQLRISSIALHKAQVFLHCPEAQEWRLRRSKLANTMSFATGP